MSSYYVYRVDAPGEPHDMFDARADFLMDFVLELREMADFPDGEAAPSADLVERLPSFDYESWLYLSHPDWIASTSGPARCRTKAIRRYADAMEALDEFVGAEQRDEWTRWKRILQVARDAGDAVHLAFD